MSFAPVEKPAPVALPPQYSAATDEKVLRRSSSNSTADHYDADIEAMLPRQSSSSQPPGTECQVWPGKEHWRRKAKAAKVHRSRCGCMAKMSKRNRIIVHTLLLALIIGAAIAIGFGISKPLGEPTSPIEE